jgi:hypothetical protein
MNLLRPLIAAEGYFFCLETKEAKIQVTSLCFFAAQGLCAAKRGSTTGLLIFCPCSHFTACFICEAKSKRPLPAAQGHQVLPRFRPKLVGDENASFSLWSVYSTTQPLNHSTTQPLNHSTTQPLNHSTTQPLNHSTTQLLLLVN